ncbi:MAG: cysteine hydrolase [Chloroflexota bacterium]|nr:cysteine hydrolase [Chloroflexota bacterium]MDE2910317.1 cysteine hydrolase [Chloroflexota bacterium]
MAVTRNSFSEKQAKQQREMFTAFDPATTALLIVDMLKDFFDDGGAMVLEGGKALYPPHQKLLAAARAVGMPVLWLNQSLPPDDSLFEMRAVHCLAGSWGAEVVDELRVEAGDIIIPKRRYSGFFQTSLDLTLRERGIDTVIVTGVVTNICVRSTVHDAFFLRYKALVPEDLVMATSPQAQAVTLYDIDTHYGAVTSLDALLTVLQRRRSDG